MSENGVVLFSSLDDIPRLRTIALEREFTRPVRLLLVNQVENQLKYIDHCLTLIKSYEESLRMCVAEIIRLENSMYDDFHRRVCLQSMTCHCKRGEGSMVNEIKSKHPKLFKE